MARVCVTFSLGPSCSRLVVVFSPGSFPLVKTAISHRPWAIVGRFPREWSMWWIYKSGGKQCLLSVNTTSRRFVTGTYINVGRFPREIEDSTKLMECRCWVLKAAASGILRLAKSSSRRFINYTSLQGRLRRGPSTGRYHCQGERFGFRWSRGWADQA